jgi:hypothetical protein
MRTERGRSRRAVAALALMLMPGPLAAGCGGAGGLAISGKVTLDGRPLERGNIAFVPEAGAGTAGAAAEIADGAYAIPAAQGPTPGRYRVEVHSVRPTGATAKKPVDPDYAGEQTVDLIPPRYHRDSTLAAEVKAGAPNTFDFALESARPARGPR